MQIQLWDTAGQERFRKSMVQHYYRNVHGIVFVFDVTNPTSFCNLHLWMDECRQHSLGLDIPRALVCNKADLVTSTTASVIIVQARHLAEVHGMSFYLTSAKGPKGEQVDSIFVTLAQRLNLVDGRVPSALSWSGYPPRPRLQQGRSGHFDDCFCDNRPGSSLG
uniref:Ras-related protein Rab-33B-like n=1 Tax=Sinocyclocheilus rhinocerous TaxID=307959 RepID=A0A673NB99_9TELE